MATVSGPVPIDAIDPSSQFRRIPLAVQICVPSRARRAACALRAALEKLPQLLTPLPQIKLVLIAVGNSRGSQCRPELFQQILVADLALITLRIVKGPEHIVHRRPIVQRRRHFARQVPLPFELEAQRTLLIDLDRRRAQAGKEIGRRHPSAATLPPSNAAGRRAVLLRQTECPARPPPSASSRTSGNPGPP